MKKLLILLLLPACTFKSGIKKETGVILGKSYIPRTSSTGIGYSSSGSTVVTSSSTPEEYSTIIHCFEHDETFVTHQRGVYEKVFEKDTVEISYKEVMYKKDSTHYDFDFIDCNKIGK